jgi:hypothetical protein
MARTDMMSEVKSILAQEPDFFKPFLSKILHEILDTIESFVCEETRLRSKTRYRAARGFKAQREIEPQESAKRVREQCSARPSDEDSIYQSDLKLKGVAGEHAVRT